MRGISIVIPTHNRLPYLKKCLASFASLAFLHFEIIVVNDGSSDGTQGHLENVKEGRLRVLHYPQNAGVSRSRNQGIRAARYDIVAFTDDDCVVDPGWLSALAARFKDKRIGFVIGQTFYVKKSYRGYFPERVVENRDAAWPKGNNIAYRKAVFDSVGYFDSSFDHFNNEDTEMAVRTLQGGFSFARAKDAVVYHQAMDWTVDTLLKSARNTSVWPILIKKYPDHHVAFGSPFALHRVVHAGDYLYFFTFPISTPLLLLRYLYHGKRDLKIFFAKRPFFMLLKRIYIYREAIRNRVFLM